MSKTSGDYSTRQLNYITNNQMSKRVLKDRGGKTLCTIVLDQDKTIIGLENIDCPNDFFKVSDWLQYSRDIENALIKTKLKSL